MPVAHTAGDRLPDRAPNSETPPTGDATPATTPEPNAMNAASPKPHSEQGPSQSSRAVPLPPLTRRQRQILDFYTEYGETHGISPTLEEVAQNFGLNKVTVFGHVAELERKGMIERAQKGISRGLRVVQPDEDAVTAPRVRLLGRIAAGQPIETLEDPELVDWNELVPHQAEVYALEVRGNSMIEDGIFDGDLVLIERRTDPRDGETVVAVLPGEEATLKRFYREPGGVRLEPANAALKPLHLPEVEVRGVMIGLVRRLKR